MDGLLPDVRIFHKAVRDALAHDEFFTAAEIPKAKELLKVGVERAEQLAQGTADWAWKPGLVVRGYVSKIDGSVQPYGLVIPESYPENGPEKFRLDLWFHGRNEDLNEVNFLDRKRTDRGQFTPPDTIVLHPYGRYCNAFKFAGEVDVYEALDDVRKRYRIDDDRTFVRGFSMGGAATWHFAVHDASRWCGANPGAGFSETPEFPQILPEGEARPLLVRAGPLEPVRLPPLRRQSQAVPDRRLQRRGRHPEAGRRRDGRRPRQGRHRPPAHRRPQDRPPVPPRLGARGRVAPGEPRRSRPGQGPLGRHARHPHAQIQPHELAHHRRPGRALEAVRGPRQPRRRPLPGDHDRERHGPDDRHPRRLLRRRGDRVRRRDRQ